MAKVQENQRKKTIRQTDVPSCSLAETIKLPQVIGEQYAFKPSTPLEVAAGLGMQPTTSGFRMLCGASAAYGLTIGGYNTATIELTDLGLKIVRPLKEGDDAIAKKEAILKPRVLNEFLTKYSGAALPRKDIAINVLVTMGVPKDRTEEVYNLIIESADLVGITREIKDKKYIDLKNINIPKVVEANELNEEEEEGNVQTTVDDKNTDFQNLGTISPELKKRVYISHGKNQEFLEPIKKLLKFGELESVVSIEKTSVSQPVPDKVMNDMRSCGAAIIHVDAELKLIDSEAKEYIVLNPNVLMEIGAAMALYGRRFILLVKEGVKLPSNLQGLFEVRYSGDKLDGDATIKLLEGINDIKNHTLPERK
jgi:predicted nucleotide-binding protein